MAWTSPRTWVTGEIVTAAVMNTHVRDNLNYLKITDGMVYVRSGSGSNTATTNSTLDTVTISTLGTSSKLYICLFAQASGTLSNGFVLRSQTTSIGTVGTGVPSGSFVIYESLVSRGTGNTLVAHSNWFGAPVGATAGSPLNDAVRAITFGQVVGTTWVGTWVLSLEHIGMTAPGTLYWSWNVYHMLNTA